MAAVAENVTEVDPEEAMTEEGTVRLVLLLLRLTAVPAAGAAALNATVQEEVPGVFTVAGEQLKPLTVTAAFTVTVAALL